MSETDTKEYQVNWTEAVCRTAIILAASAEEAIDIALASDKKNRDHFVVDDSIMVVDRATDTLVYDEAQGIFEEEDND